MKKKRNNIFKYVIIVIALLAVLALIDLIIYLCFKGNCFIPTGVDLEKKDWLSFQGSYLSFAGTIIVSLVALLQGVFYRRSSKQENIEKRKKEIQPIFSIKIQAQNTGIQGFAEAFSLYDTSKNLKHKNFTIEIENVSLYPIKHVIIFDTYISQLLKVNKSIELQCTYEDSPDYNHQSTSLIRLLTNEYEREDDGLPKWFNIIYEDIDGNEIFQTFELKNFKNEHSYYSLTETSEI